MTGKETITKKKTMLGAEAVICSLLEEGVGTIFGYPGGAIMPIYDALYNYQDQINHILVRHEQGAVHAAQGFARVRNEVGVVFATSGPGATTSSLGSLMHRSIVHLLFVLLVRFHPVYWEQMHFRKLM